MATASLLAALTFGAASLAAFMPVWGTLAADRALAAPAQVDDSCLQGTWHLDDIDTYLAAALDSGSIQYLSESGDIRWQFNDDGTMGIDLQNVAVSVSVGGQAATVTLDGAESGRYTAAGDGSVTFSNPNASVTAAMALDGVSVAAPSDVSDLFELQNGASWSYICTDMRLTLQPPTTAGRSPVPILFYREV